MTKFNDISNSYGKPFSVIAANTYAYNVLNASNIIESSLVIASPYDIINEEDVGQHTLIMTDFEGNPTRLTYLNHKNKADNLDLLETYNIDSKN